MSRPTFQSADLLRFIFLYWMLVACRCTADADDCLEVKTAYMMRQIGPVELVPNKPKIGEPLEVCSHAGPSCCNSPMEDSYMTAVRAETQQRIRSYSFELKYLLAGHSRAFQGPVVDGSLKAQRENPEMSVRNTDAGLRGAKKRLEQLIKDLLGELGWASRGVGWGVRKHTRLTFEPPTPQPHSNVRR
ncbi:unnamed protein product [Arctogadus glacialis]